MSTCLLNTSWLSDQAARLLARLEGSLLVLWKMTMM